jgi:hypothetical protein
MITTSEFCFPSHPSFLLSCSNRHHSSVVGIATFTALGIHSMLVIGKFPRLDETASLIRASEYSRVVFLAFSLFSNHIRQLANPLTVHAVLVRMSFKSKMMVGMAE